MILLALILVPTLTAAVAYVLRNARQRSRVLLGAAVTHTLLVAILWTVPEQSAFAGWLRADALGRVVVTLLSVLFLAVAHYASGYLRAEPHRGARSGRPFVSGMLAFLAAASLVALSHHLALLWIGMESTTLAVAPLVFDRRDRRSLEAVWEYLVLSSVGIALALLGIFLLATAQPSGTAAGRPLIVDDMIAHARLLDPVWLRAAFVFIIVGFGTKMGLAPMHSWKPDTYGEAPSLVAALMAGGLTSCAFLGVARVTAICFAAGLDDFVRPALIGFGLVSLVIAAAFIVGQGDLRRLLAYSSVEHMGLLVLGLGLGGAGAYGAVLHTLNNGLAKGLMFLAAGNIVVTTGTSNASETRGLLRVLPGTAVLLMVGLFAITGAPPFGFFISEFAILSAAFAGHHAWVAAALLILLVVIFVGIASMILDMAYGAPMEATVGHRPLPGGHMEPAWMLLGPAVLAALVLLLGVFIPAWLGNALTLAARALGGAAP